MKQEIVKFVVVFIACGGFGAFAFGIAELLHTVWVDNNRPASMFRTCNPAKDSFGFCFGDKVEFKYSPGDGMYVGPVDWIKVADGVNLTD